MLLNCFTTLALRYAVITIITLFKACGFLNLCHSHSYTTYVFQTASRYCCKMKLKAFLSPKYPMILMFVCANSVHTICECVRILPHCRLWSLSSLWQCNSSRNPLCADVSRAKVLRFILCLESKSGHCSCPFVFTLTLFKAKSIL